MLRQLSNRMQYYFRKWKHQQDKVKLAEKLDRTGPAAQEAIEMKRRADILKKVLCQNGYDEDQI